MAAVVGYLPSTDSNGPFALGVRADLILRFGRTEAGGAIRAEDAIERPLRTGIGARLAARGRQSCKKGDNNCRLCTNVLFSPENVL